MWLILTFDSFVGNQVLTFGTPFYLLNPFCSQCGFSWQYSLNLTFSKYLCLETSERGQYQLVWLPSSVKLRILCYLCRADIRQVLSRGIEDRQWPHLKYCLLIYVTRSFCLKWLWRPIDFLCKTYIQKYFPKSFINDQLGNHLSDYGYHPSPCFNINYGDVLL